MLGEEDASVMASLPGQPLAHVLVVNFHHSAGPQVEHIYPPLAGGAGLSAGSSGKKGAAASLPEAWAHLPFLALPDGAHHYPEQTVYFSLPSLDSKTTLFGVSCVRQINTSDVALAAVDEDVTRNTILKSVCVLSHVPFYSLIDQQLGAAAALLFQEQDFANALPLLEVLHSSLLRSLQSVQAGDDSEYLVTGLSVRCLFLKFQHRLLAIFKLLLLERRVVVHATEPNAREVCVAVASLASLMPGLLKHGLACAALPAAPPPHTREPAPAGDEAEADIADRLGLAGCPLQLFGQLAYFHPYTTLHQMSELQAARSFLVGTTNQLFVTHRTLSDVVINVSEGTINVVTSPLKNVLALTNADLRWAQGVLQEVQRAAPENPEDPDGPTLEWLGSCEWIRLQFGEYLLALLTTAEAANHIPSTSNLDLFAEFNELWITEWKRTDSYQQWVAYANLYAKEHDGQRICAKENRGHPCAGGIKFSDVKLRLQHAFNGTRLASKWREHRRGGAAASPKPGDDEAARNETLEKAYDASAKALTTSKKAVTEAYGSLKKSMIGFWRSFEPPAKHEAGDVGEESFSAEELDATSAKADGSSPPGSRPPASMYSSVDSEADSVIFTIADDGVP